MAARIKATFPILVREFKDWRERQGFTRVYIEKITKERGLHQIKAGSLNQIEMGRQEIGLSQAVTMAKLMGCSLDSMVGLRDFMPEQILLKFDTDKKLATKIEKMLDQFGSDQTIEMFYLCFEALESIMNKSKTRLTKKKDPFRRVSNVAHGPVPKRKKKPQ